MSRHHPWNIINLCFASLRQVSSSFYRFREVKYIACDSVVMLELRFETWPVWLNMASDVTGMYNPWEGVLTLALQNKRMCYTFRQGRLFLAHYFKSLAVNFVSYLLAIFWILIWCVQTFRESFILALNLHHLCKMVNLQECFTAYKLVLLQAAREW